MRLTLDRNALLKALAAAARIIERQNTIPVLSNVRLETRDGELTIAATDMDIELRTAVPAEIAEPGGLTAPAARLHDIVRKLPDGCSISLDAAGGTAVVLKSGRSRFQMQTLPLSDFPDITSGDFAHRFAMPAETLAEITSRCGTTMGNEPTRHFLMGIHLHLASFDGQTHLVAAATDSHRLTRLTLALPEGAGGLPGIIIPRKTVGEIARLVDKAKAEAAISVSQTKIRIEIDGFTLTSKLVEGTYPDYQRVIPQGNDKRVTVDAAALAGAASRVATISGERGRAVKLAFSEGQAVLSVTNPDAGEAREEIDCDYDGEPIEISFNARYLDEILGVLGGDTVLIKLADPGSPALLQTREGSPLLTVLMPMRV